MVLRFFTFAVIFLFVSCTTAERDNPDDPKSKNYTRGTSSSSSSSEAIVPLSSTTLPSSGSFSLGCPNAVTGNGTMSCGGKTYKTVKIGTQTWMAKNLDYDVSGSVCYNNDQANCITYGRLYNWATAKTVCPDGWHLPNKAELDVLVSYAGTGEKLKATSGWNSNGNGTDIHGFAALPGGRGTTFSNAGLAGYWWSSSEYADIYATYLNIYISTIGGKDVAVDEDSRINSFSVRCLKD